MPSNVTPNYQLSQWSKDDRVLMDDFNADNAKIDGALAQKADQSALTSLSQAVAGHTSEISKLGNCQIYSMSYVGGGESAPQSLTFPEKPILVLLTAGGNAFALCVYGSGIARTVGYSDDSSFQVSWSGNTMSWGAYAMNTKNSGYRAIAFCGRS